MKIKNNIKKLWLILLTFFSVFVLSVVFYSINNSIKQKIELGIKEKLTTFQKNMQKSLNNQVYLDFSKSKIICKGFLNYKCTVRNNFLFINSVLFKGPFLSWNMVVSNLKLNSFNEISKGNLNNILFEIKNFQPTKESSVLFLNNISKYAFPIDTKNIITLDTKIKQNNKKNKIKIKHLILNNSYIKMPAMKIDYNADIVIKNTPNGFLLYLDKNNNFIGKPKNINSYKTTIKLDATSMILIKKTDYTLYNFHIPKMLYVWYKNLGSKYSFKAINQKIFYINNSHKLSFKEFNRLVINIFNSAIKDVSKINNKNFKWFEKYLKALKDLYLHKIKAVKIQIVNKKQIPLQALYVQQRMFPGFYYQIEFLGKYYDIKVIKTKK